MTTHALTIDLEDWHQLLVRRVTGHPGSSREGVVAGTHRLLELLDEVGIRATFFVVGMLCDERPDLVREVSDRGHEIGSHTQHHRLIGSMDRDTFRDEVNTARKRLQDLTGQPVDGFRAPEFSVGSLDHWCFDMLVEAGFSYDSSVIPVQARYGIPGAPRAPFILDTVGGNHIVEFPLATWNVGERRVPIGGGSYWRFLPSPVLGRAISDLDLGNVPAVLYFHPYEFTRGVLFGSAHDIGLRGVLGLHHLKYAALHNFRTASIARRLKRMLGRFQFAPLCELQAAVGAPA